MVVQLKIVVGLSVLALACTRAKPTYDFRDPSPHKVSFISADSASLQTLDWGGSGPTIVLLHGSGGSAHNFDALAPLLRDQFRVISYTRRGHGSSTGSASFDVRRLSDDLRTVLDSLRVDVAALVGYSFAGNEITHFAAHYPERVSALIYLDGTYDWTDSLAVDAFKTVPVSPSPTPEDLKTLDAYRAFSKHAFYPDADWSPALESSMRDEVYVDSMGVRARAAAAMRSVAAVAMGYHREYDRVRAPALVLLAEYRFAPQVTYDPDQQTRLLEWTRTKYQPAARATAERAASALNARIEVIPGVSHGSLPFAALDTIAALIKGFVAL